MFRTIAATTLTCAALVTAAPALATTADAPAPTYTVNNALSGVASDVTASFQLSANGAAEGNLGCNYFRAEYTRDGNTLTFAPMMMTEMICAPEAMDTEHAYTNFFSGTVTVSEYRGYFVKLTNDEGQSLYAFA